MSIHYTIHTVFYPFDTKAFSLIDHLILGVCIVYTIYIIIHNAYCAIEKYTFPFIKDILIVFILKFTRKQDMTMSFLYYYNIKKTMFNGKYFVFFHIILSCMSTI